MTGSLQPYYARERVEAGCDEAGRGCLAGPVVAAAVILPPDFRHPFLNDSKKLTFRQREELRPVIERESIAWSVAFVSPEDIDELNILRASFIAMHRALEGLRVPPQFILVDGNRFVPFGQTPHLCIVKGDGIYASIAAASVIAKTHRDAFMEELSEKHPEYHWHQNKGYPTKDHRRAILQHGPTDHHRKSFRLLPGQLTFDY